MPNNKSNNIQECICPHQKSSGTHWSFNIEYCVPNCNAGKPSSEGKECKMPECQLKMFRHTHDHPNCTYSNIKPQEGDWEKEFRKLIKGRIKHVPTGIKSGNMELVRDFEWELKQFISKTLLKQKQQMIGKIETLPTGMFDSTPYKKDLIESLKD